MIMLFIGLVGLCAGSFVNALVWRLHEQAKPPKQRAASIAQLSITKGRSICRHTLAWYDLLPVVSWLALGGKCRYCRQPISWQYPLVELATAGVFILSYSYWPGVPQAWASRLLLALWLASVVIFMALLIYDLRWMLLPNKLIYPLLGLAGLQILIRLAAAYPGTGAVLRDAVLSFACLGGLFYVLFQLSGGKWIGGGDVKLGFALGLLIGRPLPALLLLFLASLLGSLFALVALLLHKTELHKRIPFGPFLIIAAILAQLFGQTLISWYTRHLLSLY
jgi:leader peptidase (prepilin peptidase)/N-methyltransferase